MTEKEPTKEQFTPWQPSEVNPAATNREGGNFQV